MVRSSQADCTIVFVRYNFVPYITVPLRTVPVLYFYIRLLILMRTMIFKHAFLRNKQHTFIIYAPSTYCTANIYLILLFLMRSHCEPQPNMYGIGIVRLCTVRYLKNLNLLLFGIFVRAVTSQISFTIIPGCQPHILLIPNGILQGSALRRFCDY